jgi:hypothetical protein
LKSSNISRTSYSAPTLRFPKSNIFRRRNCA